MRSEFRQPEVSFFENFYRKLNYDIFHLKNLLPFEGNGDALLQNETLWAGYGFRTDFSVYEQINQITGFEIIPLELQNENFYHLDTCFSILDLETVALVPEAFRKQDLEVIESRFRRIITIDWNEAKVNFAGNCHSPDSKHVLLQRGSTNFCSALRENNFIPIEVNTSEYLKSGGSVFCMKMMFF
jgi:N-dimethylarginine dimethylaminohydrolase